jgi:cephalosporin-C deacetylase-like acetyl esterase
MVWDSMRALDYLLTLPEVDPANIGITGNSGGGLNTLFTAALDPRFKAAVVVGYTFEFANWIRYAGAHCTCTHLPALFRSMEWFGVAGLIAPRPLLMLQGEYDAIFPIEGARRAARDTAAIYAAAGAPRAARLGEVPAQPHAYSKPYRERMYGWLALHLMGRGTGEPIAEPEINPLPERDQRLLCDPQGTLMGRAPSVIDLARARAVPAAEKLAQADRARLRELVAPPDEHPHFLAPEARGRAAVRGGTLEKVSFVSEEGQYIPGLLWLPERRAPNGRTVVIADERGKAAVAESALIEPLLDAGHAVLAVDLRGRGETLGWVRPNYDTNFRLVYSQVLMGRPLAGRRAFDLTRTLDFLARRQLDADVAVVGLGDDALPALLAAASDERIRRVAVAGYLHTFVSQMQTAKPRPLPNGWNDPQLRGRITTDEYEIDFGSVIPAALLHADVPEIAAAVAPKPLLFCQARDNRTAGIEPLRAKLQRVLGGSAGARYRAETPLDPGLLLGWLAER